MDDVVQIPLIETEKQIKQKKGQKTTTFDGLKRRRFLKNDNNPSIERAYQICRESEMKSAALSALFSSTLSYASPPHLNLLRPATAVLCRSLLPTSTPNPFHTQLRTAKISASMSSSFKPEQARVPPAIPPPTPPLSKVRSPLSHCNFVLCLLF